MTRSLASSSSIHFEEWRVEDSGASLTVRISQPEAMIYQLQNHGDDAMAPLRIVAEAERLAKESGATTLVVASEEFDSPTKTKWLIRHGFTPQMIVMAKQIAEEECHKQHQS